MLITANNLSRFKLKSLDGEIGEVKDFNFDDRYWTIRYLVADTGDWLTGRMVLISPYAMAGISAAEKHISVNLTKKQIEDSPSAESDKPVSRQFEEDYFGHFGWPLYWSGPHEWGPYPYLMRDRDESLEHPKASKPWDAHLRSINDVRGHHIQASDGEIGHVDDFILDDETWSIRYLVIDTSNWWNGEKVLVSPRWIERVSWPQSKVFANLTMDMIRNSPEYSEDSLVSRDYEIKLHRHYDRTGYWEKRKEEEAKAKIHAKK